MALNCSQTLSGITNDCAPSIGGIKEAYIANYDDITAIQEADGIITGITLDNNAKFHKYQFRKQTGSLTSTLNVDDTAGINYVTSVLSLIFTKMETAKRLEISALAVGHLAVIVKDGNNRYWYLGKNDYVSATNGSGNTGTAKGDSNNYTIELTDESDTFPFEVSESALADIVA